MPKASWWFRVLVIPALILSLLAGGLPAVQAAPRSAPIQAIDLPFESQTAIRQQTVNGHAIFLGNSRYSLWGWGCGVASLAMIYRHYGIDTDIIRLNDALIRSGGFSGGLLDWSRPKNIVLSGSPYIKSVERINTKKPQNYAARIDAELAENHPVIVRVNDAHYVVLTGKDASGAYLINDPWKETPAEGKNIPIEQNLTKTGFQSVNQVIFVSAQEYAPTNGIPVWGGISEKYLLLNGSRGFLGNPKAQAIEQGNFTVQQFDGGVILEQGSKTYALYGPVWEKYAALNGLVDLGLPRSDLYMFPSAGGVTWQADFASLSIAVAEGESAEQAQVYRPGTHYTVQFWNNQDFSGDPVYTSLAPEARAMWGTGKPNPATNPHNYSVRWKGPLDAKPLLGWWYNFSVSARGQVKVLIDGETVYDNKQPGSSEFRHFVTRGSHTLQIDYVKTEDTGFVLLGTAAWPAKPVFAAEAVDGPVDHMPAAITDYASFPDTPTTDPNNLDFTTPEQPVEAFFLGLNMLDMDQAAATFEPTSRLVARPLLNLVENAVNNNLALLSFTGMSYSAAPAQSGTVVVNASGTINLTSLLDGSYISNPFTLPVPVKQSGSGWLIDLQIQELVQYIQELLP